MLDCLNSGIRMFSILLAVAVVLITGSFALEQIKKSNSEQTEVYCVVDKKEVHRSMAGGVILHTYTIDVHVEGQDALKDTITVNADEYNSINEKDSVLCMAYYTEKELVDITLAKNE